MSVTLEKQIECVRREVKFRYQCYTRQVRLGKISKDEAESEIALMKAVLETLVDLKEYFDEGDDCDNA